MQSIRDLLDEIMRNALVDIDTKTRCAFLHAHLFNSHRELGDFLLRTFAGGLGGVA